MKAELDAAKIWEENWGPLFAPDEPHNYEDRIKKLEEEAAKCVSRGSGGRGGEGGLPLEEAGDAARAPFWPRSRRVRICVPGGSARAGT